MKKLKKILKVFVIIIGSAVAFAFVMNLLNPFWFRFPKKIKTKEEMFSFVENNQEELEMIVEKLIVLYRDRKPDKNIIIIDGRSYLKYNFHEADHIIRNYSICDFSILEDSDEGIVVNFYFYGAPKLHDAWGWYNYWGIKYVESGEPITNMAGVEMEKQGNEYVESVQGLYEHRTEKIVGNWYYHHTQWCN